MAKILLVDDDTTTLVKLSSILKHANHEVILTHNGHAAMTAYKSNTIDLILTDIYMPEKDGIEVMMDLIKNGESTPIIAMSSGGGPADKIIDDLEPFNVFATLKKPIDTDVLLNTISNALNG